MAAPAKAGLMLIGAFKKAYCSNMSSYSSSRASTFIKHVLTINTGRSIPTFRFSGTYIDFRHHSTFLKGSRTFPAAVPYADLRFVSSLNSITTLASTRYFHSKSR